MASRNIGGWAGCIGVLLALLVGSWHLTAWAQSTGQPVIDATPYLDSSKPDNGLQRVIDDVSAAGGGVIQLPAGTFTLETYLQLRNGVTLKGQGLDTVLAAGRNEQRVQVANDYAAFSTNTIRLSDVVPFRTGMVVYIWRSRSLSYKPSSFVITGVNQQANTITLDSKVDYALAAGVSEVSYGLYTQLSQAVRAGTTSFTLHVDDPSVFNIGEGVAIVISSSSGTGHHNWGVEENIVTAIDTAQKTLTLKDRIELSAPKGTVVAHGYGAIMSEGFRSKNQIVSNIGIQDLAIKGWDTAVKPAFYAFALGAINLMDCKNAVISNVQVSDWHSDGVSIQACSNVQVTDVTSAHNRGRGFHPGTTSDHIEFLRIHGNDNLGYAGRSIPGDGFFYCWQNSFVNIRQSEFRNNADSGIGDLGGGENQNTFIDTNNLIEDNLIENNGRDGIQISGGGVNANSIIRRNTIRDNGQIIADSAGIMIGATKGYAYHYTIDSNLVASTLNPPTQLYGIMELNDPPYNADYNTITNNVVHNHLKNNIVVTGEHSVATGNNTTPVVYTPTPAPSPTTGPAPIATPSPAPSPAPNPPTAPPAPGSVISLTGDYSEATETTASEPALYSDLRIAIGVQASQEGTYTASADLVDAAGNPIAHAETTAPLGTGTGTVTLHFAAADLYAAAQNGPYYLAHVLITDANGTRLVDNLTTTYTTAAYDYHGFGPAAVVHNVYLPVVRN